jgi:hypothetical protein
MAAENESYIVPLGIDAAVLVGGITEGIDTLEKLGTSAAEASGAVNQAFKQGSAAADQFNASIKPAAASLTQLKEQGKTLGAELKAAMNGGTIGAGLTERVTKLKEQLKGLTSGNNKIQLNFDAATLQRFETQIAGAKNEFQQLNTVVQFSKDALAKLDPNSAEFTALAQQVELASGFLEGLGDVSEDVTKKVPALKSQLRELREQMQQLELAGQGGTAEFNQMAEEAGALEDQIGDVAARVRVLASDTKYLDAGVQAVQGLVGAFAAAQGAAALFGVENEDLQKSIQKITAAMAILQGIQAVAAALNKDSALSVLLFSRAQAAATVSTEALAVAETEEAVAATAAAGATNAFTAALLANPITAIAVAIAAVVAALIIWTSSADDTKESLDKLSESIERQNKVISLNDAALQRGAEISVAYAKLAGKNEKEIAAIENESFAERIALREKFIKDNEAALAKLDVTNREDGKSYRKIQDDIADAEREVLDLRTKRQINEINGQTEYNKKQKELSKKAIEDAKKAAEEQKKISEQIIKYTQLAAVSRVAALEDGIAKERRAIIIDYANKIEDVQKEKSLSEAGEKAKTEAITALTNERNKQLADLNKKQAKERAELELTGQQLLADAQKEGAQKELDLLNVSYLQKKQDIITQFKDEADLRIILLQALESQTQAARDKINKEAKEKALSIEEGKDIALIELSSKYSIDNENVERKKQIAILQVKLEYAKKSLDLLTASGKGENDAAVLDAKVNVKKLQDELSKGIADNNNKPVSFLDLIGLGDGLTDGELQALNQSADKVKESLKGLTDFVIDQYQRQIDKKQETIDQYDKDIDKLEDQVDDEKDLQQKGLANNLEAIQADLAQKQQQKNEEVKQQEELIKKQTQMRRIQVAIDTAVQASNLITSATNIFSALSGIPFVGIPLAIATIALMTGAFIAARAKAFQAVNEGAQTFGEGGIIDGKSHSQGGQKYRSVDGRGGIVELEGGEYVVNKKSTAKYKDAIDAINYDDFSALSFSDSFMNELLKGMGIHLMDDGPKTAIKEKKALDKIQVTIINESADNTEQFNEMAAHLRYLATEHRERPYSWQEGDFIFTQKGSKRIKTSINKPKIKEDANTSNNEQLPV